MLKDKDKILEIMYYFENNTKITEEYKDYDNRRLEAIKEIIGLMDKFFSGSIDLESFRMEIDVANKNKRNPLWGFKGFIGQMYFNLLCKLSENKIELNNLLIKVIKIPKDIGEAKGYIDELNGYIKTNSDSLPDKRKSPNQKATLFFLSYFWQIQGPDKYPIFYPSLEKTFLSLGILEQNDSLSSYYENFYIIKNELRNLFQEELNKPINYWFVEHVFLEYYEKTYKNENMEIGEGKMGENSLNKLLESKKQIILYGPPGTGKTFKTKENAVKFLRNTSSRENLKEINQREMLTSPSTEIKINLNQNQKELYDFIKNLGKDINEILDKEVRFTFDSVSKIQNKPLRLAWFYRKPTKTGSFGVHVRKDNFEHTYPDIIKTISQYTSDGGRGYPAFKIISKNDLEKAKEIIKFAYDNL